MLPRRERRWINDLYGIPFKFQSTLPQRERRGDVVRPEYHVLFQSTLPRRERPGFTVKSNTPNLFQSTLPRRERRNTRLRDRRSRYVSIHAPAKGATGLLFCLATSYLCFNPRSREGSDHDVPQFTVLLCVFQSTLPRRERQPCRIRSGYLRQFQSTLP